ALPDGILFLSAAREVDSLAHPAASPLLTAWAKHGVALGGAEDLRTYLRKTFFGHHKKLYENLPIYFPLSSAQKSYVALVSIHRWRTDTLQIPLAAHLLPEKRHLEGELEDLRAERLEKGKKARAERRFADVQKYLDELRSFVDAVSAIAQKGPPP